MIPSEIDDSQTYTRLTEVFHEVFDDESIIATPELTAKDVDGWDSITHIRLMLTIEKAFGVKFSVAQIGKLQNVGDLAQLIRERTT
jgi:acyl carrier protein